MKKLVFGFIFVLILTFGFVLEVNAKVLNQSNWILNPNPVFDGNAGAYYPRVLIINGTHHMWYTEINSNGAYGISYTNSPDEDSFGSGVMTTGLSGRPDHVVVINVGNVSSPKYRIWYADSLLWPFNLNLFRTAQSDNGINWFNDTLVSSNPSFFTIAPGDCLDGSFGPGPVLYRPDGYGIVNDSDIMGNKYVMYYSANTFCNGTVESGGLAYSNDGINWKRYGNSTVLNAEGNKNLSAWDFGFVYPWSVVKLCDGYHMWYSGGVETDNEGVGYATSADGINWVKDVNNPVFHAYDPNNTLNWTKNRFYTPMVILDCNISQWKMYFSAVDGTNVGNNTYSIGLAKMFSEDCQDCRIGKSVDVMDKDFFMFLIIFVIIFGLYGIIRYGKK